MLKLGDTSFDANVKHGPMLIMFTAPWAGPCNLAMETFQNLAKRRKDVLFAAVDVDDSIKVPARYNVRAVPMFLLIDSKGAPLGMKQGAISEEILGGMLDESLPDYGAVSVE